MDLDLKDPALPVSRRHSFRIGQASVIIGIDLTPLNAIPTMALQDSTNISISNTVTFVTCAPTLWTSTLDFYPMDSGILS